MGTSFLSLHNGRSGPRFGALSVLRTSALPLDAGKRQAHYPRAHIPRVLWTQGQYCTWPGACHERFLMLAWRVNRRRSSATAMRHAARSGRYRPSFRDTAGRTVRRR
jgi:hypothetical protein